jgi:predicted nucleic acid-binding protein
MARSHRPRRDSRVRETATARYAPTRSPSGLTGILFDSDVIIEALRGRYAIVDAIRDIERTGVPTYCCAVSFAEIWAGLRPGEEAVTEAFFSARGEVALDAAVGRRAGAYLARYSRSHGLEMADALVAGAASTAGLRLWTLNRRHYPMTEILFHEPPPRRRR